jgi:predicted TIM-barrel fold metal-dependent hydrolase
MLLRHLDFCGIDRAVIFPPFACQLGNDRMQANLWALGETKKHKDRFIPAGTIFPLADDVLEMLAMLHDEGAKLAKIHPSIDLHDISDPAAAECYAKAEELGIALDYHTGPHGTRLSLAEPGKFDDIAWDYPHLKLVFEHLGGRTYFEQFMAILGNHKAGRIFGGLTSVLDYETNRMWYLGEERVTDLIRCIGAHKLIYGLDFPWNSAETNKHDIEIIRALDIEEDEKERILGGSLAGLLGL